MVDNSAQNQEGNLLVVDDEPPRTDLPRERVRYSTWRQLLVLCVSALTVVCLANSAAMFYVDNNPPNKGYAVVKSKWKLLDGLTKPVDWLVLGDSSCLAAIDPVVWTEATGDSVLNLCTLGDLLLVDDVWLLKDYLSKHGAPKGVVVMHVYDMWYREVGDGALSLLGQIERPWGIWTKDEPKVELNASDLLKVFLARFVPILSQANSIRQAVVPSPTSRSSRPESSLKKFGISDLGLLPGAALPLNVSKDTAIHKKFVRANKPNLSAPNRQALLELISLAEEYDFRVQIVMSPLHDELNDDEAFQTYFEGTQKQLSAYLDKTQHVEFVSKVEAYPASTMQNSDNLGQTKVEEFTKRLVRDLVMD